MRARPRAPVGTRTSGKAAERAEPVGVLSHPPAEGPPLFDRVAAILEQARGNVVRAVNSSMVLAYWLIGREIVHDLQGGEERAEYGKQVIENLSARLTERYGKGFSAPVLWSFRQFYLTYSDRVEILFPAGRELAGVGKLFPAGTELAPHNKVSETENELPRAFSPVLSWSHYRALMRVENREARDFYEREASAGGWDKRTLERQIQSFYYERILKSRTPEKMRAGGRDLPIRVAPAADELKNPYVLEFLGLRDAVEFHESDLERAIITHLQRFLLELGTGFAFVARQKHIRIEEQDRYIDLIFYHCRLKFYLLIDLKVGELTHADVGQMDGYVRMFDGLFKAPDDNPTIGLILCTEKNETVARYSVLNDRTQIFASRYMLCLPTEEQLRREVERERRLIEAAMEDRSYE
ncbi:MAG TPA: PDDEXK nuclease domain-containing protein [Candidatus Latescibacteria bacterium]|nr:PDDEXK nuclease domain-containing protein [Candidatus Latescibacterota bacterium]HPC45860.1 PDDEXK nuclease domain-containing protein [Candidatus Latescibacterota bacterium]HPK76052.1 PDDEXK nuclease domain-containing protein [Candidatus Latescibacterota bacterium]